MSVAFMNRAQRGLYHGSKIQYGNNIGFSNLKTRRTWKPNVQRITLFSDLLGESFQLPVTTYALRIITKFGGLDNYLLFNKDDEIDSSVGYDIKSRIIPLYLERTGETKWNQSTAIYKYRQQRMQQKEKKPKSKNPEASE